MIEFPITLTSGGSVCMPGYVFALALGYTKNLGVYRLAVTASGEWEGLTIRCFWHVPDGKDPSSSLVVDGYVAVPASVTAQPGSGCITFEGSDGAKVMTSADLRYRVSANSGTEDGTEPEPGTPAWQQLVDAVHTDATAAEQAKTDAQTAAQQAGASAQKAGNALSDTITAKEDALKATKDAQTAASEASASAENAALAQVTASQLAGQAADSASEAQNSATKAAASQQTAESNAAAAQGSATKAEASASTAVQGQQRAEAAAARAETAQQQTESASTDALDKISSAKTDALKAIGNKQTSATTAVESAQGKALDAVADAKNTAVTAVTDAQTAATQAVGTVQANAIQQMKSTKTDALKAIGDKQTAATQAVDTARDKALQQVGASTEAAQTAANKAATSAGNADQSAQKAAGSLQELKNGIASGDFKGEPGNDGKSPVVTVLGIENGHRVSITDKDGTKTIDVLNGKDGKDAPQIDDTTVGLDAWSSKHIVDMLCPPLEETGNPVQCYPVAEYPLGCKVSWEPVQEGSGTPYPAGGGKNLFNPAWMPEKTLNNGLTWTTTSDGTVTANGTANGTSYYNSDYFSLPAGTYTISAMPYSRMSILNRDVGDTTVAAQQVGQPCTFTVETDIQNASLFFATSGILDNVSAKPQIEKGTTATAYAPYENIRSIKGKGSVTVERCGGNLLNPKENANDTYTPYGLTITYIGDNKVHLSGTYQENGGSFAILDTQQKLLAGKGLKITGFTVAGTKQSYTLYGLRTKNETVIAMSAQFAKGDVIDMTVAVVVSGTTAPTTYAPYTGQTATLTLPRTIYGGTVDAVTGEGNENAKIITLDGNELKFVKANIYINLPNHSAPGISKGGIVCCSHFNKRLFAVNTTYEFCFLLESDMTSLFASVDDLNAYLAAQYAAGTPVQIAYKLAEPMPFTAPGAQPIPALSGVNTVLTDADSATVTGKADPIKRITDLEDAVASMTTT